MNFNLRIWMKIKVEVMFFFQDNTYINFKIPEIFLVKW